MRNSNGCAAAGGVVLPVIAGALLFAASDLAQAHAGPHAPSPPTQDEVDFATEVADLLQAELIAALLQEFDETTPENVEQGKVAISLIFADDNPAFRLVGEIDPLRKNDVPQDAFEKQSLALALQGQGNEAVENIKGKYYVRRSIPLSNFSPACVLCHSAFGPTDPEQWVGALMLRVPAER